MKALKTATFIVGKNKYLIDSSTSEKELKAIWDKEPSLRRFIDNGESKKETKENSKNEDNDNDSEKSTANTEVQPKPKSSGRGRKPKA